MDDEKSSSKGKACYCIMLAVSFSFAIVNILLKKVLEKGVDYLVFITYRLAVSALVLGPVGYFWESNGRPKLTVRILCYLFLSAILGASLPQYFFLWGIHYTSATFASAFVNMVPVITFMMALPFGLEIINIRSKGGKARVIGAVLCVGGALILILYKGMPLINHPETQTSASEHGTSSMSHSRSNQSWTLGCMACTIGTLLWSCWFIIQSMVGRVYPYQYSSIAIMSLMGAIQSAVLCLSTQRNLSIWMLQGKLEIITLLYAGMVGSGLCFVGMSWCVKKRGPVFTSSFSPLIQIVAAAFDIPVLHENLYLGSLVGSLTVIAGLYILLWGKNKESSAEQQSDCSGSTFGSRSSRSAPITSDAQYSYSWCKTLRRVSGIRPSMQEARNSATPSLRILKACISRDYSFSERNMS